MPMEYCEFNHPHVHANCLKWRARTHPELMPEVMSSVVTTMSLMVLSVSIYLGGLLKHNMYTYIYNARNRARRWKSS